MSQSPNPIAADVLLKGATLLTMNADRAVYKSGAMAIAKDRIVWVGQADDAAAAVEAKRTIDAAGQVISPGFINGHVHITGDPLTRHYMPDDLNDDDRLFTWVVPRYYAHTEEDERLSALFGSVELMKSGTTTFVEAGTIRYLDPVVDGLRETGVRARVGAWVEGRSFEENADAAKHIDEAKRILNDEIAKYPSTDDALVSAWPILVGHTTNPDEVWLEAKALADRYDLSVAAHMSPYASDPEWFEANLGSRPVTHLQSIGALGPNVILTHATHLDTAEIDALAATGTNIAFCPYAAIKGAFGVAAHGRYLEMIKAGVNFVFATDGYEAEVLPATRVGAAIFKDLGQDVGGMSALRALEKITCEAAKAVGMEKDLGSLEVGKKADFVCFDTNNFQWRPLHSPLDQLVWSADGRSIKDVWIDGVQTISDGRAALIDEAQLLEDAQNSAERIIERSSLPYLRTWSVN
ncbi:MAG: amidohydrolase family protein [Pseudomonadota bacterium]